MFFLIHSCIVTADFLFTFILQIKNNFKLLHIKLLTSKAMFYTKKCVSKKYFCFTLRQVNNLRKLY
jgi:hypothetical protein